MAIHPEHDYFAARATEETAAQLANRNRREERRRAERRRALLLTVSGAALGLVLMAGGITALGSTRAVTAVERATSVAPGQGMASPQSQVAMEATIPPVAVPAAPTPPVQKRAERGPASEAKKQARARSASESKQAVPKPATPVSTPAAKPVAKLRPTSILVRKCSAGCHPTAALLTLRFDSASAAIVTDGMVEAQGVRLTKRERAAVIAALTRK